MSTRIVLPATGALNAYREVLGPTSSSAPEEGGGTGSCSFPRSLSNSGSERPLNTSRFQSTKVAESGMVKGG
jgi:hypothetical protein